MWEVLYHLLPASGTVAATGWPPARGGESLAGGEACCFLNKGAGKGK
ncbi:MAG: hypothetical protein MUC60_12720 [Oscillatoria sp. Prado101]|nr:hypothetical protein [Oscillatoria sp. Prado101]